MQNLVKVKASVLVRWLSGKARPFKSEYTGSIPVLTTKMSFLTSGISEKLKGGQVVYKSTTHLNLAHSSKSKDIWFSTIKSRSVTGMGYKYKIFERIKRLELI